MYIPFAGRPLLRILPSPANTAVVQSTAKSTARERFMEFLCLWIVVVVPAGTGDVTAGAAPAISDVKK